MPLFIAHMLILVNHYLNVLLYFLPLLSVYTNSFVVVVFTTIIYVAILLLLQLDFNLAVII